MVTFILVFILFLISLFDLKEFSPLFKEFRSGKSPILVATDVAARGLGKFYLVRRGQILIPFFHNFLLLILIFVHISLSSNLFSRIIHCIFEYFFSFLNNSILMVSLLFSFSEALFYNGSLP